MDKKKKIIGLIAAVAIIVVVIFTIYRVAQSGKKSNITRKESFLSLKMIELLSLLIKSWNN